MGEKLKYLWWCAGVCATLVMLGWGGAHVLATKEDVAKNAERIEVAASQAQFALDQQIEDVTAKIARLAAKPNKTAEDLENLRYWRGVLQRLRAIRAGKK